MKISLSFVSPRATQEVLGMSQFFGGIHTLPLAEVFAPSSDDAVIIGGEKEPDLWNHLFICQDCALTKELNLGQLIEKVNSLKKDKETD
jgi:hypothetical protein